MTDEVHRKEVSVSDDLTWIREMAGNSFAAENHYEWLEQNVSRVSEWIGNGLNSKDDYRKAVETVLTLLAFAQREPSLQPCFLRVAEAVQIYPVDISSPFQVDFRSTITNFRRKLSIFANLRYAAPKDVADLLQAYLKLIKILSFNYGISIQQDLIDQAISVSQKLNDYMENAKLNQTLAHYYIIYGDTLLAEQHGKMSFTDYEHVGDAIGIADAACTLAIIYRVNQRFTKVEYYIERALKMIEKKAPDKHYATLYYEKGALCYSLKEYRPALAYYQRALEIFEEYGAVHQTAMTHQAMAQVHIFLSNFDDAEALLQSARRSWEKLQNQHDLVNNYFVTADLELERGDSQVGLRLLHETIELAYTLLEDNPARARLIDLIEQRIETFSSRSIH
jgi:tetratricopeptide (TPR) repeat protein